MHNSQSNPLVSEYPSGPDASLFKGILLRLNLSCLGNSHPRYTFFKALYLTLKVLKRASENEKLISKTSYNHSYMLLICTSCQSKVANFQHKIHCKWRMSILELAQFPVTARGCSGSGPPSAQLHHTVNDFPSGIISHSQAEVISIPVKSSSEHKQLFSNR